MDKKLKSLEIARYDIKTAFALIITNDKFDDGAHLPGTILDNQYLQTFCEKAHFETQNERNLDATKIRKLFEHFRHEEFVDHDYSAFICFISSHGNKEGIVGTDGESVSIEEIVEPIIKNKKFLGKPKLFFFDSCRGRIVNEGQSINAVHKYRKLQDDPDSIVLIPSYADAMISRSTWSGHVSNIDQAEGSWFITVLTKIFIKYAKTKHLTDMLVLVNQVIAEMDHEKTKEKQMPCFTCSLRHTVWFNAEQM